MTDAGETVEDADRLAPGVSTCDYRAEHDHQLRRRIEANHSEIPNSSTPVCCRCGGFNGQAMTTRYCSNCYASEETPVKVCRRCEWAVEDCNCNSAKAYHCAECNEPCTESEKDDDGRCIECAELEAQRNDDYQVHLGLLCGCRKHAMWPGADPYAAHREVIEGYTDRCATIEEQGRSRLDEIPGCGVSARPAIEVQMQLQDFEGDGL